MYKRNFEETNYLVVVNYLVGIYQERRKSSLDMWLRFCFECIVKED